MEDKTNYLEAITELESIVAEIENQDITVDELSARVKRASELIGICRQALHATEEEVKKILDELNQEKS